jgi:hypothetical protein
MYTLIAQSPISLRIVAQINRLASNYAAGAHQSRTAGHVGTGNTPLVARSAQRGTGKHRAGAL